MRGRPAGGAKPGADPTGADYSAGRFQVPAHWTPAQAVAVFEMLDELRDSVWRSYGSQIQQALREDRAGATSATAANLGDGDVPF
jgi:hypothetical protein